MRKIRLPKKQQAKMIYMFVSCFQAEQGMEFILFYKNILSWFNREMEASRT